MSKGWIKIHRQIMDHPFYEEDRIFSRHEAWEYLLLNANHADAKVLIDGRLVDVERGSFITSVRKLQERWKWSNTKVIQFLDLLEDQGMASKKSDTKKTVVTIDKYDFFQGLDEEKRHENDTETIQKRTNKNVKNENNEKKEEGNKKIMRFTPPTLDEVLAYIAEKGLHVDGHHFYDYFTIGEWIDSKGNKVRNWKQKLQTWEKHSSGSSTVGRTGRAARQISSYEVMQDLVKRLEADEDGNNGRFGETDHNLFS